jgi:uncharacterized YccA/Bax inhibitor family protein
MGQLYQYTGAISGLRVTSASTAMFHILQHGKGIINNLVRLMAMYIGYKSGSARIVFKFRPIEALLGAISLIHLQSRYLY